VLWRVWWRRFDRGKGEAQQLSPRLGAPAALLTPSCPPPPPPHRRPQEEDEAELPYNARRNPVVAAMSVETRESLTSFWGGLGGQLLRLRLRDALRAAPASCSPSRRPALAPPHPLRSLPQPSAPPT
jgi:hypothetical protein